MLIRYMCGCTLDLRCGLITQACSFKAGLWNCPIIHLHTYQHEISGTIVEKKSTGYRMSGKGPGGQTCSMTERTGEKSTSSATMITHCGKFSV